MNILKRLFKIGQAEANSAIDKLEDPIKVTEQGIRDLKKDLDKSLQSLAEVKSMAIRSKKEMNDSEAKAKDYEHKAMLILQKAERGDLDAAEADRLASEALLRKEEELGHFERAKGQVVTFDKSIAQLEGNIKTLRSKISSWENELKTLKARVKVSEVTKKINKQMTNIDSNGTVSMLERMKDKVAKEESLAEAYGDIANESKSVDEELDKVLADEPQAKASDALAELKAKMKKNN